MSLKPGEVINSKYEVIDEIGAGGAATVYRVHHRQWNLDLAVKDIKADLVSNDREMKRFINEAQAWIDLGLHPNIVQLWFVCDLKGRPALFLDLMPSGSLKEWIRSGMVQPGDWEMIIDLAMQVCDGLAHAHFRGLTHRDIKPANMLVSKDGRLCLTDFGLARYSGSRVLIDQLCNAGEWESESSRTISDTMSGTPEYGSPEQWTHGAALDERTDIYSLGVVLYEMCCGQRPFDDGSHSDSPLQIIKWHKTLDAPDPRDHYNDIPESLVNLILHCLKKKCEERPQTVYEVREKLTLIFREVAGEDSKRKTPEAGQLRADSTNNMAVSLYEIGENRKALAKWNEALTLDPHHPESVYNKTVFEWEEGVITDDIVVERLENLCRIHKRALVYLGYFHLERMAPEEAERSLEEIILENPDNSYYLQAITSLGDAYMAQERYSDAKGAYVKAIELASVEDSLLSDRFLLAYGETRYKNKELIFPRVRFEGSLPGNGKGTGALEISANGRFAVTGGMDGVLTIWNLEDFSVKRSVAVGEWSVVAIAISPDGAMIASAGWDTVVRVWETKSFKCLSVFKEHEEMVLGLVFAPDGLSLFSGGADRRCFHWNAKTGARIGVFEGHSSDVTSVAILPGGKRAVSGDGSGVIRVWSLEDGVLLQTIEAHAGSVNDLRPNRDGSSLFSVGADGVTAEWNPKSGDGIRKFAGHESSVRSVDINDATLLLVTAGADGTVRIWEADTGICLRTLHDHSKSVESARMAAKNPILVTGGLDSAINVYRVERTYLVASERFPQVNKALNHDQAERFRKRFEESMDQAFTTYGENRPEQSYTHLMDALEVTGFERDPDAMAMKAGLMELLPIKSFRSQRLVQAFNTGSDIHSLAIHKDGEFVVVGDSNCSLWNLSLGRGETVYGGGGATVTSISGEGEMVLTGEKGGELKLWEPFTGEPMQTIGSFAQSAILSNDGRIVIYSTADHAIKLWDVKLAEVVAVLNGHENEITAIAISRVENIAISADWAGIIYSWNLETDEKIREFTGHDGCVRTIAITPDGCYAVTGGFDSTVRLWNLETGDCVKVFDCGTDWVLSIAVTPDGRFIVSGSFDNTIRILSVEEGRAVYSFKGSKESFHDMSMTRDARFLVTGGAGGQMRRYELDWELMAE